MRLRTIWTILTLRCEDAARLMSDSADRPLHPAERIALRLHLLICGVCRRYRRQLQTLHELIARRPPESVEPVLSAATKDRMRAKISQQLDRGD